MKLFKQVIEQRLRSYPEDIGFINKYQSGFRQAKSTDDHSISQVLDKLSLLMIISSGIPSLLSKVLTGENM